jgi:hypothetical protein
MSQGVFTADFLFSVEKRMRNINEFSYAKMLLAENIWWPRVLRPSPIESKSERVNWLLETASIEQLSPNDGGENGGSINFDELSTITTEYFPAYHARGYKVGKLKLLNMMNAGLDPAAKWASNIGTYGAYYPQRLAAIAILNGGNVIAYDGVDYFSASHPVHPLITGFGTYANLFTGSASGSYPGALPIDDTQSLSVAFTNLNKGLAYIEGAIPMPNGAGDPRMLEPAYVLYPPRMKAQVTQLFDAEFIAQAVGSAGGSGDIKGVLKKWRMLEPVEVKEFDGNRSYTIPNPATGGTTTVTGSNTTWYVVAKEAADTQLGALLHTLRMPFTLHTYTGDGGTAGVDAVLGRSQDLEWHYDGWQAVNYGHPYALYQFNAT